MIVGLGVDITEISRIEGGHSAPWPGRFSIAFSRHRKLPTVEGIAIAPSDSPDDLPSRKAAMKALGTGWARGVRWVDIEVVREPSGKAHSEIVRCDACNRRSTRREKYRRHHHA